MSRLSGIGENKPTIKCVASHLLLHHLEKDVILYLCTACRDMLPDSSFERERERKASVCGQKRGFFFHLDAPPFSTYIAFSLFFTNIDRRKHTLTDALYGDAVFLVLNLRLVRSSTSADFFVLDSFRSILFSEKLTLVCHSSVCFQFHLLEKIALMK